MSIRSLSRPLIAIRRLLFAAGASLVALAGRAEPPVPANLPVDLRCEYLAAPLGIDTPRPRLSWRMAPPASGGAQSAYRIQMASSPDRLARGEADLWDSGKVNSAQSANVVYAGKPLLSRQSCWWKVRVWESNGAASDFSAAAVFELGLLQPDDWQAIWIGGTPSWPGRPAYFSCTFPLPAPPKRARLYIAGMGNYEAYLNGRKLGNAVLEPALTDVSRRVLYRTYDVTAAVSGGLNVLAAIVGGGWEGAHKLRAQLELEGADGAKTVVATGENIDAFRWNVGPGPITSNSIWDGETYDARLEKPEWNTPPTAPPPGPNAPKPVKNRLENPTIALAVSEPAGRMEAASFEPIRVVEHLAARTVNEVAPGRFVFDFGQNHAGWARLTVHGPRGAKVTLRYAENLDSNGQVNQENLRSAAATDTYILSGKGEETWEPRFTYHGYRYVQVEGWPGTPGLSALTSCVVRSDLAFRGEFECSDEVLNGIHRLVRWTEQSNLMGMPTDCPQRNERLGWLNDLGARSEEMVYNFNTVNFLENFVSDIRDTQDPRTGTITDTAPYKTGFRPADPVSVCYLLIPALLAQHYGDTRVLEKNYDGMRKWVDYLTTRATDGIVAYSHWGDWAPPTEEGVPGSIGTGSISARTPGPLISTACYFYSSKLISEMAGQLGRPADQAGYAAQADRIGAAFNRAFWREELGGYGSGNQACNAIALYLGLVPAANRPRVVASLVRKVEQDNFHLTTGNLCTKYLLEALSAAGQSDAAVKIATQKTYPGWGYMLENGATTLWERWALLTGAGMNSHNHPMLGSVDSWLYRWVAGIRLGESTGTSPHFVFEPPVLAAITQASAVLPTLWGPASIAWQRRDGRLHATVRVPWNCSATMLLPGVSEQKLSAGIHEFEVPLPANRP